jgi:hypothetical protein
MTQLLQGESQRTRLLRQQPRPSVMLVFQMSRVVLSLALNGGGAGGLRRDFEFVRDLGFFILVDV